MSNPISFRIVDSTLREGEQHATVAWASDDRVRIARELDAFGVDAIEMTSPTASPRSARDLSRVAGLGLRATVLTHVRCRIDDAARAVDAGAQGVNLLFGTSPWLQAHAHGRGMDRIVAEARTVVRWLLERGVDVRFSCEDAFRTPLRDLIRAYQAMDTLGIHRIGIADTVGAATPREVFEVVAAVRKSVFCDIEFHGHNDGGCATANAWAAIEAGATHVSTSVLGIGERNGITPLAGLAARAQISAPESLRPYRLERLVGLDRLVARLADLPIPHTACISAPNAFTHKAGMHTKAVLADPRTYEAIDPEAFGRRRDVLVAHHLCGRHAIAHRAVSLGIALTDDEITRVAATVKSLADRGVVTDRAVDELLLAYVEERAAS